MSYTVLARKWRPKNFSELVGQAHVMQALANALDQNRLHHAYLFTGTRGVGKTTIARIFSKALNCEQGIGSQPCGVCSTCRAIDEGRFVDLIEVDAASKTKVEDTRELLDNVQYAPVAGRYKVYLIDEVHMLSKSSFNALLKTLEEPPEHVKFLLATTDPHKLPVTVLSRCLQFNLMRLTQAQIHAHLAFILQQEGLSFDEAALAMLAKSADGSARDALSLLDQSIAYGGGEVRQPAIKAMLGLVDQNFSIDILSALLTHSAADLKLVIEKLALMGVDYHALCGQLIEVLHQISLMQVLNGLTDLAVIDEVTLTHFANQFPAETVQIYYQIALMARQDMDLAPDVRIGFEMALLRMLAFEPRTSTDNSFSPSHSNRPPMPTNTTRPGGVLPNSGMPTAHAVSAVTTQPAQSSARATPNPELNPNPNPNSAPEMMQAEHKPAMQSPVSQTGQSVAQRNALGSEVTNTQTIPPVGQNHSVAENLQKGLVAEPLPGVSEEQYAQLMAMRAKTHAVLTGNNIEASPQAAQVSNATATQIPAYEPVGQPNAGGGALANQVEPPLFTAVDNPVSPSIPVVEVIAPQQTNTPNLQNNLQNNHNSQNVQTTQVASQFVSAQVSEQVSEQISDQPSWFDDVPLYAYENDSMVQSQHEEIELPRVSPQVAPQQNTSMPALQFAQSEQRETNGVTQSANSSQTASAPTPIENSGANTPAPMLDQQSQPQDADLPPWMTEPQTPETQVSAPVFAPENKMVSQAPTIENWMQLIEQMQLSGMALALANHAMLLACEPDALVLSLDPEHPEVMQAISLQELKLKVAQTLGAHCVVQFQEFAGTHLTPAKYWQQNAENQQNQAEREIYSNSVVQQFIETLDMRVIQKSIKPINS